MEAKKFMSNIAKKKVWKKKSFWISVVGIVLVVAVGAFFLSMQSRRRMMEAMATSAQSATVTVGSISNTVEGSGSLEAAETVEVKTFSGLKIKEVKVESGEEVKKGQKLVTLDKVSVTKVLVEVQASLEDVEDELDNDDLSSLETEALKAEKSELQAVEKKLKSLRNNPVIKAKSAGIIGEISVSDNSEVSKGSSSNSSSSSGYSTQLTSTGTSAGTSTGTSGRTSSSTSNSGLSLTLLSSGSSSNVVTTESVNVNSEVSSEPQATSEATAEDDADEENQTSKDNTNGDTNSDANGKSATTGNSKSSNSNATMKSMTSTQNSQSTSSSATSSTSKSSSSSSTESYSADEVTIITIYKQNKVKVTVSVDELDILDVEKGQSATITLDALEDEEFEGTITKVASSATAGSGSTKYEVQITIPMTKKMRIGMSATASIKISEAENVLTIPMTALQQRREETFVYTSQDSDGNLSGEVAVETGLSDGDNVEITSGLEEGMTVYYMRSGSSDSESSSFRGGMMPGGFAGGGQGGSMPGGNRGTGGSGGYPGGGGMRPSGNQ